MLSWWTSLSLETLTRINNLAQLSLGILISLTAIATLVSYFAIKRITLLQDANSSALEGRLTTAESNTEQAKKDLKQLQENQKPRTITPEQRKQFLHLVKGISNKGTIHFSALASDQESQQFAVRIRQLVVEAGWSSPGIESVIYTDLPPAGIVFTVKSMDAAPSYTIPLQKAFRSFGPLPQVTIEPTVADDLNIDVGIKPSP